MKKKSEAVQLRMGHAGAGREGLLLWRARHRLPRQTEAAEVEEPEPQRCSAGAPCPLFLPSLSPSSLPLQPACPSCLKSFSFCTSASIWGHLLPSWIYPAVNVSLVGWRLSLAGPINHMLERAVGEAETAGGGVLVVEAERHLEAVDCSLVFSRGFLRKAGRFWYCVIYSGGQSTCSCERCPWYLYSAPTDSASALKKVSL